MISETHAAGAAEQWTRIIRIIRNSEQSIFFIVSVSVFMQIKTTRYSNAIADGANTFFVLATIQK